VVSEAGQNMKKAQFGFFAPAVHKPQAEIRD